MAWRSPLGRRAAGRLMLAGAGALLAAASASIAPQAQQCGAVPAWIGTVASAPWPPAPAGWATPAEGIVILVGPPYPWYPVSLRVYTESTVCLWQAR